MQAARSKEMDDYAAQQVQLQEQYVQVIVLKQSYLQHCFALLCFALIRSWGLRVRMTRIFKHAIEPCKSWCARPMETVHKATYVICKGADRLSSMRAARVPECRKINYVLCCHLTEAWLLGLWKGKIFLLRNVASLLLIFCQQKKKYIYL